MVRNYVNNLSINDLEKMANEYNINHTSDELIIIYDFIKYRYNDLLDKNIKVFDEIKGKINPVLYKKLLNLYLDYKNRYL